MAHLNVFTSYAHEDQKIAEALCSMLQDIFGEDIHVFYDKECLHAGEDIDDQIKEELKQADTMLVVSTGAIRASHSWTGFELGYFTATHEPKPGVRGKVISICTHDDVPPTEESRRYVSLKIEKELLDVDPVRAGQNIEVSDSDELLQFLGDLVLEIEGIKLSEKKARRDECKKHARQFKLAVVEVYKTRIKEIRKPQKQFLIRYNIKDVDPGRDSLPPDATIISVGGAIGLFGVPSNHSYLSDMDASELPLVGTREKGRIRTKGMKWKQLRELIANDPLALHWSSALCQVVISAGTSSFDADNSQVIMTHNGEARYRLILTTSTTFYDGSVEASVYLVKALLQKDYGRHDTTLLLKGLHIVCRFRFLFLESQSDFYWFNVNGWGTARLPRMARQLLTELGLMQTEAQDAELHKPGTWEAFVSIADLEAMMESWMPLETEIRKLCLRASEPDADEAKLSATLAELRDQLKLVANKCSVHNAVLLRAIAAKLAQLAGPSQDAGRRPDIAGRPAPGRSSNGGETTTVVRTENI
jgi:hypothetical protein